MITIVFQIAIIYQYSLKKVFYMLVVSLILAKTISRELYIYIYI